MHSHPQLFNDSGKGGTAVGEAGQANETTGAEDSMNLLDEKLDILDGQQIQHVGRNEPIDRIIRDIEFHAACALHHLDTTSELLQTFSRELDHGGAHILRHIARVGWQVVVQQYLRQRPGSAAKLEDRLSVLEMRMLDQLLDGGVFVESLGILPTTESVVELPRLVVS